MPRVNASTSFEIKQKLIASWINGEDYKAVARVLNIYQSTARSIIKRHQRGETLVDKRGGRRQESAELREESNLQRISNVPTNLSQAEHRLRVLNGMAREIIEDQITLSGAKVDSMTTHVMRYIHRCFAKGNIELCLEIGCFIYI